MQLEQQLAAERQQHDQVRGLLQKAERAGRTLEARLQQAALAQREELDVERGAVIKAQRALDDALFEIQQRDNARQSAMADRQEAARRSVANEGAPLMSKPQVEVTTSATSAREPTPAKVRGRPRTRPLPEPKPVRWWTPSYKAKTKR